MRVCIYKVLIIISFFLFVAAGCSQLHVRDRPYHQHRYYEPMIG